ncbi:uncharacterized protein TRIVIDRAFT_155454 [Trichoderma virens Gv29-8]|uniref:Uncharacterized protein n=1 Tax=Hypocrea virens (strain Gv29-8 / FGSC 10586) TaxID=413071 RepID=G9MZA9_HYPVG|nr:uncharacterized protein TRIVIDRAFT_155454 [Trichoderma virens Gv29-8]EHK19966.1 hypothetical protein TRIVIDRAFT_155454 [Trichoderma virens Gv29-8]UKZ46085.1 hypothetical protein TrVGV298_000282 [Trichoderma virens]
MTGIAPQPNNPTDWQKYATSDAVTAIPLREGDNKVASHRGVFLDAAAVLDPGMHNLHIYTDVLAFMTEQIIISPAKYGTVNIVARVLTAAKPVTLCVPSGDASTSAIAIYARILDQPISVCMGNSEPVELDLGADTEYVGAAVALENGKVVVEYLTTYPDDSHAELQESLETELRIALVQFWINTSIAISICSYVASITADQSSYSMLNTQAVALGQQLAGQVIAGQNMTYAPVLVLSTYEDTMKLALAAASAYEIQYDRFQDKASSLEVQIEAWKTMLSQATDNETMQGNLRDSAYQKYQDAAKTADSCNQQFKYDNDDVQNAGILFQNGIEKWKFEQKFKAIQAIFTAVITFAVSIGEMFIGNPAGASGAAKAVEAAKEAENIADQVAANVTSGTLEKLKEVAGALGKLYPSVSQIVKAINDLESNPDVDVPSLSDISGTANGDADSSAIVTMAAWDKWILESDDQMTFGVTAGIEGAAAYQLALRKHAINGKQLAQAQAEAIKAGYEYVQAQMEVIHCKKQVDDLQSLINNYTGQEDVYLKAEAQLYDRLLALKTGVVIELQNMVWAYRYWALTESRIVLDATKSIEEYDSDLYQIARDMETVDEQYPSDFQGFTYYDDSDKLPFNFGQLLVEGLAGETNTGSFTLAPNKALAGVFFGGSHYRLSGLDPTLRGALPKKDAVKDGVVIVHLQITTSGIYEDIQDGQVFRFASLPQSRQCSYELNEDGSRGNTWDDPIFETKYHAEPTPFTQWKIKLLNPEDIDLSRLAGVDLKWEGHVRFGPTRCLRDNLE